MPYPQPQDFFGEHPPARIIGTERECNIQLIGNLNPKDYITPKVIRKAGYKSISGFLSNGQNLDTDVNHIEVSTGEELGPKNGAAADTAAMLVVGKVVDASGLVHDGIDAYTGSQQKNQEKTSGRHENYLMPRDIEGSDLFESVMVSHLTSRIYGFSGIVRGQFELSQKVNGIGGEPITRTIERQTDHGNKPMAIIPPREWDEDVMGHQKWARLEVRFADAGFSLTAKYLSLAATSLVLRLIEHPDIVDVEKLAQFSFANPVSTARRFNKDLTFTALAETDNGSKLSAINYQEMLADAASDLAERIELPEDERVAIPLWYEFNDELRKADLTKFEYGNLLQMYDVAPLHYFLHKNFPGGRIQSDDDEVLANFLLWYRMVPKGDGFKYWEAVGSPYVSERDVNDCVKLPAPTRAQARTSLINRKVIKSCQWSGGYKQNDQFISLGHPYDRRD